MFYCVTCEMRREECECFAPQYVEVKTWVEIREGRWRVVVENGKRRLERIPPNPERKLYSCRLCSGRRVVETIELNGELIDLHWNSDLIHQPAANYIGDGAVAEQCMVKCEDCGLELTSEDKELFFGEVW